MDKSKSIITKILIVVLVILLCVTTYFIVTKQLEKNTQSTPVQLEEQAEEVTNEPLYALEEFPKIDGSTATQPLIKAYMKNFTGREDINFDAYPFSKTHQAYEKLIQDQVDIILVTSPSEEELALAKSKGVELEVIPVVREGFVFYVNTDNPVTNLSAEQIQNIYSGKITNWKDVGGEDTTITPYQRPVNSGSQTGMLDLVMKDKPLMAAPKENLAETMAQIVNLVSSFDNGKDAIGYSYYYYATTMYQTIDAEVAGRIKLLGIDGIQPTVETIKNRTYPFTTSYYMVINKADGEDSTARKLANQMLSTRGQQVALQAGYVPVK